MGTPITGLTVVADTAPARCAAMPAAAINTAQPRWSASCTNALVTSGVRWAEVMRASKRTPKERRTSKQACMTGKSESDPITIATNGSLITHLLVGRRRFGKTAAKERES